MYRKHSEAGHQQRMFREEWNWAQNFRSKFTPAVDEGTHETFPRCAVESERSSCFTEVTLQHYCRTVVKGVSQSGGRVNPLQAMINQRQRREEWRPNRKRVYRRSE